MVSTFARIPPLGGGNPGPPESLTASPGTTNTTPQGKEIPCPGKAGPITVRNTNKICGESGWVTPAPGKLKAAKDEAREAAKNDVNVNVAKKMVKLGWKCGKCKPHPERKCTLWVHMPPEADEIGSKSDAVKFDCVLHRRATADGKAQIKYVCCPRNMTFKVMLECVCNKPAAGPITHVKAPLD